LKTAKDTIYTNPLGEIAAFKFDDQVAKVFPDMISRSVPGYSAIIGAIGLLAGKFAQPDSSCYDLGCSLGASALAMRETIKAEHCRIIAVDNSPAMIANLKEKLALLPSPIPLELICSDIRDTPINNASVVVLNFTLQFIPLADRLPLLRNIRNGLHPGGILILSEKIRFDDEKQNALQSEMHLLFKKANGYSDLEISQKRLALENVLIPETYGQHRQRLQAAGFSSMEVWFQYFNFASMIALA
jgi:tRNA (cmo5U34)-methyltransferase